MGENPATCPVVEMDFLNSQVYSLQTPSTHQFEEIECLEFVDSSHQSSFTQLVDSSPKEFLVTLIHHLMFLMFLR